MKKNIVNIVLVIICIAGLSLLLYPSLSDYYNSLHQTRAIVDYENNLHNAANSEEYVHMMEEAKAYNRDIPKRNGYIISSEEQEQLYEKLLSVSDLGMMGYIEIPSIRVSLPIYHYTTDSVLQSSVGHISWSSLPTGGESTHCLLSGHRGLPSAKLFTNLDRLGEGDIFKLYILDSVLTYQVDKISVIEPDDTTKLKIIEGGDFCTLITCTPYGINSHRLLVRGQRIATTESLHTSADAMVIEPLVVAPIISVPIFFALILYLIIRGKRSKATKFSQAEIKKYLEKH